VQESQQVEAPRTKKALISSAYGGKPKHPQAANLIFDDGTRPDAVLLPCAYTAPGGTGNSNPIYSLMAAVQCTGATPIPAFPEYNLANDRAVQYGVAKRLGLPMLPAVLLPAGAHLQGVESSIDQLRALLDDRPELKV
jgi:hypothetical protein